LERLHPFVPLTTGGILWVLVGTLSGLLAAVGGGWMELSLRARNERSARRAEELALEGKIGSFEALYWRGVARIFLRGATWSVAATVLGVALASLLLPRIAGLITGPRAGWIFAALLGGACGGGFPTHVRAAPRGRSCADRGGR